MDALPFRGYAAWLLPKLFGQFLLGGEFVAGGDGHAEEFGVLWAEGDGLGGEAHLHAVLVDVDLKGEAVDAFVGEACGGAVVLDLVGVPDVELLAGAVLDDCEGAEVARDLFGGGGFGDLKVSGLGGVVFKIVLGHVHGHLFAHHVHEHEAFLGLVVDDGGGVHHGHAHGGAGEVAFEGDIDVGTGEHEGGHRVDVLAGDFHVIDDAAFGGGCLGLGCAEGYTDEDKHQKLTQLVLHKRICFGECPANILPEMRRRG